MQNSPKVSALIAFLPQLDFDEETSQFYVPDSYKERNQKYIDRIEKYGAKILQCDYNTNIDELIEKIDGWLIPGGADIEPQFYGEEPNIETVPHKYSKNRALWEQEMYQKIDKSLPVLGICYGAQIINVLNKGTLIQHLNNAEDHRKGAKNKIKIEKNSALFEIIGDEEIISCCNHHQLVKRLGNDIKINCYDELGLAHGIEIVNEERWILAVQWHPERCEDDLNSKIFKSFVERSLVYKNSR